MPYLLYGMSLTFISWGYVDNGVDTGVDNTVDIGIDNGVDIGVDNGVGIGVDNGVDIHIEAGFLLVLENGFDRERVRLFHFATRLHLFLGGDNGQLTVEIFGR